MKKFKHLILLTLSAVLLFGLQGCGENQADKDMRITDSINAKLSTEPLLTTPTITIIVVETKDGVVTLTGTVDNDDQAQAARRIAESVDGVVAVQPNLTVEPKAGSMTTVPTPAPVVTPVPPPVVPAPTTPSVPTQGMPVEKQELTPVPPTTVPSDTQTAPMTTPQDQVQ